MVLGDPENAQNILNSVDVSQLNENVLRKEDIELK